MYRSFFEMERMPFVRDVPIQELYESPAMSEALGRLAYAADHQLFAVITADAGCGKSTLLRRFSGSLSKDEYLFLYLSDSKLTPRWFYKSMLDQLGIESKFYRGDAKRQLQKEVEIIQGVQKKKVVCILDEAHLLEKETIEEFRFLLNYRFDSMSPMALILAGQTELWDKLRLQRYAAVRQRIDINCVLPHFDRAETEKYILSHLVYARGRQRIITIMRFKNTAIFYRFKKLHICHRRILSNLSHNNISLDFFYSIIVFSNFFWHIRFLFNQHIPLTHFFLILYNSIRFFVF